MLIDVWTMYQTIKIAHVRHLLDKDYTLIRVKFQVVYTTIFGLYSCYTYIKSESLVAPIVLHIICNTLQFPKFNYLNNPNMSNLKGTINLVYLFGIISFIFLLIIY